MLIQTSAPLTIAISETSDGTNQILILEGSLGDVFQHLQGSDPPPPVPTEFGVQERPMRDWTPPPTPPESPRAWWLQGLLAPRAHAQLVETRRRLMDTSRPAVVVHPKSPPETLTPRDQRALARMLEMRRSQAAAGASASSMTPRAHRHMTELREVLGPDPRGGTLW